MKVDIERERIQDIINHIDPSLLNYQEWINVGQVMKDNNFSCHDWDAWSASDPRWKPGECERKWAGFGHGSDRVKVGTLYFYAENQGYDCIGDPVILDWNTVMDEVTGKKIIHEGWNNPETIQLVPAAPSDGDDTWQRREIIDYLSMMFQREEYVAYELQSMQDDDGKWKPSSYGVYCMTAGEIIDKLREKNANGDFYPVETVLGSYEAKAGAWIRFNPVDGGGVSNKNITQFRYALVESDTISIEEQWALIQNLKLPCRVVVSSGSKSIHAIVKVDAVDYKQYQQRVDALYKVCKANGLDVDTQDKNPSRLSRFPGFWRGEKKQYIMAKDIGLPSFDEWIRYINDEAVEKLPEESFEEIMKNPKPIKEPLIDGILRKGHKMMVSASSKAGKTFLLIELAIAIAEGGEWCGFKCRQGRVLYLDMELDAASFDDRVRRVYQKMNYRNPHYENLTLVHMRGQMESLKTLIPRIVKTSKSGYDAIILDPIYKMGVGDENSAEDVADFCNSVDRIANGTGASVIYVHHHSKGAQGAKASMDRASGSGVFARDADALLDMMELHISDDVRSRFADDYPDADASAVTAFRVNATLREFKRISPVDIFFMYPIHMLDEFGWLNDAKYEEDERAMADGRKKGLKAMNGDDDQKRIEFETVTQGYMFNNPGAKNVPLGYVAERCKGAGGVPGIDKKTVRRRAEKYGYTVNDGMILWHE